VIEYISGVNDDVEKRKKLFGIGDKSD